MTLRIRTADEAIERAEEVAVCNRKPQTVWQRQTGEYVVTSYRRGDERVLMFVCKVDVPQSTQVH